MTKPWTYLSLKAVFQYMDGNKRLEFNSRCPALRSAEISVPLNLQSLTLEKKKIVVNEVCYKVESTSQRVKTIHGTIKIPMVKTISDGRKHVCVENLEIYDSSVIPKCLKFIPRNLDSGDIDLERVLPFINRTNFPLTELRVNVAKNPNVNKYLGLTHTLILFVTKCAREKAARVLSVLYDRKSTNIVLENVILTSNITVVLIQNWRDKQKEIGTALTMHSFQELQTYFDELLEVSNGRIAYLNNSVLQ
ncbi:hypothetical protein CRE_09614 [Caenorhabditis remanei]|uniref:DUF38 domain-containing protein n=1 Tax=Caenorhabditis remanei TaxID=31234 RepID=E3MJA1_CAERE|nr:hypothetical protein CRE_09614 [Caenorhabditis remanei]